MRKKSELQIINYKLQNGHGKLNIGNWILGIRHLNKGFSLVEILIGLSSAALVGVLLISLLSQNSRIFSHQNAKVTDGISLNNSITKMEETIKTASGVVAQYPITGQATFTTNANTLVLSAPSISAQGLVIENITDYLVVTRDSQNTKILRFKVYPNAGSSRKLEDQVLATNLSKVEFSYKDSAGQIVSPVQASKIGYIINIAQTIGTNNQSSTASGELSLRNN